MVVAISSVCGYHTINTGVNITSVAIIATASGNIISVAISATAGGNIISVAISATAQWQYHFCGYYCHYRWQYHFCGFLLTPVFQWQYHRPKKNDITVFEALMCPAESS